MTLPSDDTMEEQILKVSPYSDLAGYHYETDLGHYTTFFWQASSNVLYTSTLLKKDPSWVPVRLALPVASDAKKKTPITAVNWSNGLKAAVYYLDDMNIIHERVSSDGGITWTDGRLSALSVPTRSFSDLAALISEDTDALNAIHITLYYQDSQNLIREVEVSVNDGHWHKKKLTDYDKLYAMGGTRIAAMQRKENRSIITQSVERSVQGFSQYLENGVKRWFLHLDTDKNYLMRHFDRGARLGSTADSLQSIFYAYDNGTVTERVWEVSPTKWKDPTTLPTSTGTSKIFPNFIVLSWPQDMDCTSSEVHLLSTDESGLLWDYLVGLGTEKSVSLLGE